MKKHTITIVLACLFTAAAITLGYLALGWLPAFIFTFGYLGGFIIWLFVPARPTFKRIALPYFLTLALFVVHKVEERKMDFFPALSEITGEPVPASNSVLAILLYAIAAFWLTVPFLVWKKMDFGYYLAWTFFASMGITELAHFVLPFFNDAPYGYFPGMASVVILAPLAWWGMYRLSRNN